MAPSKKMPGERSLLATQTLLVSEYNERIRIIASGRLFGRFVFLTAIAFIAIHGFSDLKSTIALTMGVLLFAVFWWAEERVQRRLIIRLSHALARTEERPEAISWESVEWQDSYLKHDYFRTMIWERPLNRMYQNEPLFWSLLVIILAYFEGFMIFFARK